MDAERIVRVAFDLNCSSPEKAIEFVRVIAEHCAELADEASVEGKCSAGDAIREAFRIR